MLPALVSLGQTRVDVASRTRQPALPDGVAGHAFTSYEQALRESDAEIVYVSTRNHEHRAHVEAVLRSGRHAIVDKPAATAASDARALVDLARRTGGLVAEATVYPWHPQFDAVRALIAGHGPVERLVAVFTYPPLDADNFRYRAAADGGALWDLGPYAITPGRLFFGTPPEDVSAYAATREGDEVETGFTVALQYAGNRTLAGLFSMTTAYVNRLDVLGSDFALTFERAFTTPADASSRISGQIAGERVQVDVPAADAFALFLEDVMRTIPSGQFERFHETLLADADALHRVRTSALGLPG